MKGREADEAKREEELLMRVEAMGPMEKLASLGWLVRMDWAPVCCRVDGGRSR